MEAVFVHCAGLDVHKRFVVACVLVPDPQGGLQPERATFKTTTAGLEALACWLTRRGVEQAVMESTGVYWKPVFNVLSRDFEVWIVNAHELAQVPGRKTDYSDAEWITRLMRFGLLRRSFIPDVEQRDLRDLTRYRTRLIQERAAGKNRLHKILEDANIKLSSVASNIQGVSARLMLEALCGGESDPAILADLAKGKLRHKIPELEEALTGRVRPHHRFLLQEILYHLDGLSVRIAALDQQIRVLTAPWESIIQRLDAIPGVDRRIAEVILAEIGPHVTLFPTAKHLAAWACVCPGNNISGNKRRSGKIRRGQNWLRPALVEAAWAASRTKDTYLAAQFHRLRGRRGEKRAAVAVAHSILVIIYHLLADPEAVFTELGGDFFLKRDAEQEKRRAVKKLETLGFDVTLSPQAAAA